MTLEWGVPQRGWSLLGCGTPHSDLEIADCNRVVRLAFDLDTEEGRENSLHKLDTLAAALSLFRATFLEELEPYDRRERELEELRS